MFGSSIVAAFLASSSLAFAVPTVTKRDGTGSVNVVNNTPSDIPYALVGEGSTISSGTISAGATQNLPMNPSGQGFSVKLAGPGGNPMASSGILQFEYTYDSSNQNSVSYDWSCVNCSPNPFTQYQRTITPGQPSDTCTAITCNAGQDDSSCEFTDPTDGPVLQCPDFDGVVLTATIG